jgi:2'-5' RNA ligase
MLYYIGYFPPKEFQDFYTELIMDIGQRFQLEELVQRRRVPHITLKAPFEINSTKSLDKLMSGFCRSQEPSKINVIGIGSFGEEIIYLNCQPLRQMVTIFKRLLSSLGDVKDISWSEYDTQDKKFHITLVKKSELNGQFRDIFNYLNTKHIEFVLPFDNLAIFKKDGGKNAVHRLYYLDDVTAL